MRIGALVLGFLFVGCPIEADAWQARIEATNADAARLFDFVANLHDRPSLDRVAVERALGGARLAETDRNGAFALSEASGLMLGAMTLAHVDFREPVPGGPATAGALLVLDVEGPCIRRETIEKRVGALALTEVPRGHSIDEKSVWSLVLPDRTLGFGFPERDPGCLGTVSLGFRSPPEKEGNQ